MSKTVQETIQWREIVFTHVFIEIQAEEDTGIPHHKETVNLLIDGVSVVKLTDELNQTDRIIQQATVLSERPRRWKK
jgi:hypothetical protein